MHERRAGHQLLAEDADVAPALQRAGAAEQRALAAAVAPPGARLRPARRARRYASLLLTDQSIYFAVRRAARGAYRRIARGRCALRVAAVQLNSSADRAANLRRAERLTRAAAADGAS